MEHGSMKELVDSIIGRGYLQTPRIIEAFYGIDRRAFMPEGFEADAYLDVPLPIGEGQTISQPSTVAIMLELLQPQEGDRVLDVGSGSGWSTALLAAICVRGTVEGIERVPALVRFGQRNLQKSGVENATIEQSGALLGKPGREYDRILVSAAAKEVPEALLEQLKPGGVMVLPVRDSIYKISKDGSGKISTEVFWGFRFVPLVT